MIWILLLLLNGGGATPGSSIPPDITVVSFFFGWWIFEGGCRLCDFEFDNIKHLPLNMILQFTSNIKLLMLKQLLL